MEINDNMHWRRWYLATYWGEKKLKFNKTDGYSVTIGKSKEKILLHPDMIRPAFVKITIPRGIIVCNIYCVEFIKSSQLI